MRKYLLLTGAALISFSGSAYAAINCAVPPTCDELGYAYPEDWCENQAVLKCPFDQRKVFCGEPFNPSAPVPCEIGTVYATDGQCYNNLPSDVAAIGVIFNTKDRLMVDLGMHESTLPWSPFGDYSTTGTSSGGGGEENTKKIIKVHGTNPSYPYAAYYCYNRTDEIGPGSWFLPSLGELSDLYSVVSIITSTLNRTGFETFIESDYWAAGEDYTDSHTIMDGGQFFNLVTGNNHYRDKGDLLPVRCIAHY